MHRGTPGHMRLPHRLQGQKVKSQGHGAGAYCGGHLAAQLVKYIYIAQDREKLQMRCSLSQFCASLQQAVGVVIIRWRHSLQAKAMSHILVTVPCFYPPQKKWSPKRPFLERKFRLCYPSSDGHCMEAKNNSRKTKTAGITTISRLLHIHVW